MHGEGFPAVEVTEHVRPGFSLHLALLTSPHRNRGPWKVLREVLTSTRYGGTAISFVSFCLRAVDLPRGTVPTLFSGSQRTALVNYKGYLVKVRRVSEDDVDMFQGVLASVLFREEDLCIATLGKLACPVQSYMALLALRSVGKFVKASLVTQPISRLMYLSRNVALLLALGKMPSTDRRFIS